MLLSEQEKRITTRIDNVEQKLSSRLQNVEILIQDVISGREEMQDNLTQQMEEIKMELDKHTSYLKSIRAQLRRFSPRCMFIIIVAAFFLWCVFLWLIS